MANVWRPDAPSKVWIIFVTDVFWSFFFCYIFARGYEGKGLVEGARYGAIIGLFFAVSQAYNIRASSELHRDGGAPTSVPENR